MTISRLMEAFPTRPPCRTYNTALQKGWRRPEGVTVKDAKSFEISSEQPLAAGTAVSPFERDCFRSFPSRGHQEKSFQNKRLLAASMSREQRAPGRSSRPHLGQLCLESGGKGLPKGDQAAGRNVPCKSQHCYL